MATTTEREITGAYREFEEATQKPFAWRRPFRFALGGNIGWAAGYVFTHNQDGLVNFYTNPETAIPTAAITIATLIPYLRAWAKERQLNKLAVDIAKKEGRTPQAPTDEKIRTKITLKNAAALSYPNPDLTRQLLSLAEQSWIMADYLRLKREKASKNGFPDETQIAAEISSRALRIARGTLAEGAEGLTKTTRAVVERLEKIDAQIPKETETR